MNIFQIVFLACLVACTIVVTAIGVTICRSETNYVTQEDMQYAQWRVCVIESDGSDGACQACDAKYNPDSLDFRVEY